MNYMLDFLGIVLILGSGLFFVIRRQRLAWLARGGLLLGLGLIVIFTGVTLSDPGHRHSAELKLRVVTGLLSFLVLIATLEAVRRTRMRERYALLWVGTGFVILLFAIFPRSAMASLQRLTGMQYVTAVVMVIFGFLLLVAFHYSIMLSRLQDNQGRNARRIALLEARVEEFAKQTRRTDAVAPGQTAAPMAAGVADDSAVRRSPAAPGRAC